MRASLFLIAAVALSAATATAQNLPGRRGGMWEMSMTAPETQGHAMKMRQCVNPATERSFSPFNGPHDRDVDHSCTRHEVHRIAGGWAFESVCLRGGKPVTTTGTITGDFQTHYKMDISSRGPEGVHKMTMDNTWVGPCPAGGKDTMVLPDGRTIHIPHH